MKESIVNPLDLKGLLESFGWQTLDAVSDQLWIFTHPDRAHRQLVFPRNVSAPDYPEACKLVIEKLAASMNMAPEHVHERLQTLRDDVISYRISSPDGGLNSLPLGFAAEMISAAQLALLAAACNVIHPSVHHKRLAYSEANQLIKQSRLGHTQPGSFILNVACPVDSPQGCLDLGTGALPPLGRLAVIGINQATQRLIEALENDALQALVDEAQGARQPLISANLCDALVRMHDPELDNDIELRFRWSHSVPLLAEQAARSTLTLRREYFSRLDEVGKALRASHSSDEDTYVGTVESLNGDKGDDGRRHGEVILALLIDGDVVRTRVLLEADDYQKAIECHAKDGHYVSLYADVLPGRQPRSVRRFQDFRVIRPGQG